MSKPQKITDKELEYLQKLVNDQVNIALQIGNINIETIKLKEKEADLIKTNKQNDEDKNKHLNALEQKYGNGETISIDAKTGIYKIVKNGLRNT